MISLKKTETVTSELKNLYIEYMISLSRFDSALARMSLEKIRKEAKQEIESALNYYGQIYLVFSDNNLAGMVIVGTYPNAFCRSDIYIQEFYIRKAFRRKGIGREVFGMILHSSEIAGDRKDVSMFILQKNDPANKFWGHIMVELGFEDRTEAGCFYAGDSRCTWHYYSKKGEDEEVSKDA